MKKFIPKVLTTAALIGLIGAPIVGSPLTAHAGVHDGVNEQAKAKEKKEKEKEEKEKREKEEKEKREKEEKEKREKEEKEKKDETPEDKKIRELEKEKDDAINLQKQLEENENVEGARAAEKEAEEYQSEIDKIKEAQKKVENEKIIDFSIDKFSADAWGKEEYKKWQKGLTKDQKKAVIDYTGNYYGLINKYLRQSFVSPEDKKQVDENKKDIEKMVKLIDGALKKSKTSEIINVYRRLGSDAFGFKGEEFVNGNQLQREKVQELLNKVLQKTVKEDGYMSTSLAQDSSDNHIKSYPILLKLKIPKGTSAAYVGGISKMKSEETELLVARGYSYKITDGEIITQGEREYLQLEGVLLPKS
ncbi:ADP-ribosyltransferase [Bacillus sp. 196mf]|uniref:ADP-ribosyltransferase n=1 Tax=Bacillus sp. 196mf TaxID=1761754 RepID=UPI000D7C2182|nr:ADP-ribosyltransferase [Bacillus sp. 196mf]PYE89770.1 ADP-ribosyltransferase exoenzyme [Bacillus sp. 196mf]